MRYFSAICALAIVANVQASEMKLSPVKKDSTEINSVPVKVRGLDESGNTINKTLYAKQKGEYLVFEGDIALKKLTYEQIETDLSTQGIIHSNLVTRWPNGIVPFDIDNIVFSANQRDQIFAAMLLIEEVTDVSFVHRSNEVNYVYIKQGFDCVSFVGNQGDGRQELSLDDDCFEDGTPVHELLHALGFWHEQSREDRDDYITIFLENVAEENRNQFTQKISDGIDVGEYDYISLMHYENFDFSINGLPVIVRKDDPNAAVGGTEMSAKDIRTLELMYGSNNEPSNPFKYIQTLDLVPPASNQVQQGFIRLTNILGKSVNVTVSGIDDDGNFGDTSITFSIPPYASQQINSNDIEAGNAQKGLLGKFGDGYGAWRLNVFSDVEIGVSGYIRTAEGFLTQIDAVSPARHGKSHIIPIFNPASNVNQVSKIRLINVSNAPNVFSVSGVDDNGSQSQGEVTLTLQPRASAELTSQDLEFGNGSIGVIGSLGNGAGKWLLNIESTESSRVINLLEAPGGYLSNLSSFGNREPESTAIFCGQIDGARIYGNTSEFEYLGFFGSEIAPESITNPDTLLGSQFNSFGLLGNFGIYGSSTSDFSHRNPEANFPPLVVKNGKALFRLSANSDLDGVYTLESILNSCTLEATTPELPFDPSF